MLGACFLFWCLGCNPPSDSIRLTAAQDVYRKGLGTNRLFQADLGIVSAGWMRQEGIEDALYITIYPVHIELGPLTISGGGAASSAPMPHRGTQFNWAARARFNFTPYLSLDYVHFSNSGAGKPNPSLDMVGISVRVLR